MKDYYMDSLITHFIYNFSHSSLLIDLRLIKCNQNDKQKKID